MKIILSRKGFDSSTGKVASPIFPSGELCSLPIPEMLAGKDVLCYQDIMHDGQPLGDIVRDLTRGKITPETLVHLDPDLNITSVPRRASWKPAFGQAGAAERHLSNQGVGVGDVFLFYGWFRQVELCDGVYRYVRGAPELHVIFGWLQIEERFPSSQWARLPAWARDHAHYRRASPRELDSLYIATDRITLNGVMLDTPGAGIFPRYFPSLCLTSQEPYLSRRYWCLPRWMAPTDGRLALTYHPDPRSWETKEDHILLRSAGRGQEFVLDCDEYPEAITWLANLIIN